MVEGDRNISLAAARCYQALMLVFASTFSPLSISGGNVGQCERRRWIAGVKCNGEGGKELNYL